MTDRFRLTMAQLNATVGDLPGNAGKAREAFAAARAAGADMLALPEMFITGYQTQDLVLKPAFLRDAMAAVERQGIDASSPDYDRALINAVYDERGRRDGNGDGCRGCHPMALCQRHPNLERWLLRHRQQRQDHTDRSRRSRGRCK